MINRSARNLLLAVAVTVVAIGSSAPPSTSHALTWSWQLPAPDPRAFFVAPDSKALVPAAALRRFDFAGLGSETEAGTPPWLYLEDGDLPQLKQRGRLRVLTLSRHEVKTPLRPASRDQALIAGFAAEMGLEPVWIPLGSAEQLIPALLQGKGDVVVGPAAPKDLGPSAVEHTLPLALERYQVISRASGEPLEYPADLAGRRLAVRESSAAWPQVRELAESYPSMHLDPVADFVGYETLLERLRRYEVDAVVVEAGQAAALLDEEPTLKVAFDLTEAMPVAWRVRSDAVALHAALNAYLLKQQPAFQPAAVYREDWEGIRKRGVLRMLTRATPESYFLVDGELVGFEYELMRRFAERHGLRLQVRVAASDDEMLDWLQAGRGDLIAAPVALEEFQARPGLALSSAYDARLPILVGHDNDGPLAGAEDLGGRVVILHRDSPHWALMERLRDRDGIPLILIQASPRLSVSDILDRVAGGGYGVTVIDAFDRDALLGGRPQPLQLLSLHPHRLERLTVRDSDQDLLAALNGFLQEEFRGEFFNVVRNRYRGAPPQAEAASGSAELLESLSPFDDLARGFADRYGFDWRLIVAQMFVESRFNPKARSEAGAQGLMQLLPATAASLGFDDVFTPELGIHAGVRYMDELRGRFEAELAVSDRTWFALAAYNAGFERVQAARRLAARRGLDPNRWFGHVEQAMGQLTDADTARSAGTSPCRCGQTVHYVRAIQDRYDAYVQITDTLRLADAGRSAAPRS